MNWFLAEKKKLNKSEKTLYGYKSQLQPFVNWCEDKQITRINEATIDHMLDNKKVEYYALRANAYIKIERWDEAISDYCKALELSPSFNDINLNIGYCYSNKQDYLNALQYFDKVPNLPETWLQKSMVYDKLGKIEKSLNCLNYVLDEDPDNDRALNLRANILRDTNRLSDAYKDIFKAIELDPNNAVYLGTLAEIYAVDNKIEEFYINLALALKLGLTNEMVSDPSSKIQDRG